MANFFEKLKKGMGIEMPAEGEEKKPASAKALAGEEEKEKPRSRSERGSPEAAKKTKVKKIEIKEPAIEKKTTEETKAKEPSGIKTTELKETWLESVGQLAVDVYQTKTELVIQSAIAGVKSEDLDISLERDIITIAGERKRPVAAPEEQASANEVGGEEKEDYFSQECYWGKFSRQIILPVEVDPNRIEANLKDGILTIRIPKLQKEKKRKIAVRG